VRFSPNAPSNPPRLSPPRSSSHLSPPRPQGVGLTALLMSVFLIIDYITSLVRLAGGAALFSSAHAPRLIGGPIVLTVVFFILWNYWEGENWSRVLVLIWSFLIAIEGLSSIWEHAGGLTGAMSQPVLFLKFATAVFLVYWLNTRPLRAYFAGTPTAIDQLSQSLSGKLCTAVENYATGPDNQGWRLAFEHDAELFLDGPWRLVVDGNLSFSTNAGAEVTPEIHPRQLLQNVRVKSARVAPRTSDLFIAFEMGIELQTWTVDPQVPQWRYSDPSLTVTADSLGLTSRPIASHISTEDSGAND